MRDDLAVAGEKPAFRGRYALAAVDDPGFGTQ